MEKVAEKLDNINQTLEKMLMIMDKPENKIVKAFALFGLFVGALGIVNIIDTVLRWFIGG
ncbi:MAG: hypothetical protein FWD36_09095 [Treponema sp.]|nr:hypothetical protein [Treponema sp.]